MKYEINDESINGNSALVKANVIVYDYYKVDNMTNKYLNEHPNEFNDINGMFDNEIYNSYRLYLKPYIS
jgi:hypothetical protein